MKVMLRPAPGLSEFAAVPGTAPLPPKALANDFRVPASASSVWCVCVCE